MPGEEAQSDGREQLTRVPPGTRPSGFWSVGRSKMEPPSSPPMVSPYLLVANATGEPFALSPDRSSRCSGWLGACLIIHLSSSKCECPLIGCSRRTPKRLSHSGEKENPDNRQVRANVSAGGASVAPLRAGIIPPTPRRRRFHVGQTASQECRLFQPLPNVRFRASKNAPSECDHTKNKDYGYFSCHGCECRLDLMALRASTGDRRADYVGCSE